ncbi:unnamed protein product [Mytilus coruscus]|uniref:DNA 3'-5' helicase n=1 Tax=Mytilus coruscus TaxID=42192 RepID=A0A6J8ACS2_MYTCO|nr:unnamed protein product [Mytilus coruscus]
MDTYPDHKRIVKIQNTSGITINPVSFFGHSEMPYPCATVTRSQLGTPEMATGADSEERSKPYSKKCFKADGGFETESLREGKARADSYFTRGNNFNQEKGAGDIDAVVVHLFGREQPSTSPCMSTALYIVENDSNEENVDIHEENITSLNEECQGCIHKTLKIDALSGALEKARVDNDALLYRIRYLEEKLRYTNTFSIELSESADDVHSRRIAMFHRSTAEANKVHVMSEFPKLDSKVRVVFATIAFGMGVDIADVEQIIHWGVPRGLEQFTQESGRAGRDGRHALSVVYFSSFDISKGRCKESVADFCKKVKCCKEILSDYFSLDNKPHRSITKTCKCCSFCKANCECGSCDRLDFIDNIASTQQQYKLQDEDADLHRHISDNESILLKENLLDFYSILEDEDAPGCTYLNDSAINEIVRNAPYLYCEEDIISLGVGDIELAREILFVD